MRWRGDFAVLAEVLACAYVHAAVDLAGVGRDDLRRGELAGQLHCVARLAGGGGAEHHHEVGLSAAAGLPEGGDVDDFGEGAPLVWTFSQASLFALHLAPYVLFLDAGALVVFLLSLASAMCTFA